MALYGFAQGLIQEAGIRIKQLMEQNLTIETKSNPNDLVTNVDKATEDFIFDTILETYPNHQVLGEEGHGHDIDTSKGTVWIVDPIDGTLNFVFINKKISQFQLVFISMVNLMQVLYMMLWLMSYIMLK